MKTIKLLLFSSLLMISGCAINDEAENNGNANNEFDQFQNENNPNVDEEISSRLGYVHYSKEDLDLENQDNQEILTIDRNQLADAITRLILQMDGYEDAATLVTDDEVLVAYDKPEDMDRSEAATAVKKTAVSVVPRYYHVYVSDQPVSFRDIQSLQNSTTLNDDYRNTLDNIIEDMKEAPQGEEVYEETYD